MDNLEKIPAVTKG